MLVTVDMADASGSTGTVASCCCCCCTCSLFTLTGKQALAAVLALPVPLLAPAEPAAAALVSTAFWAPAAAVEGIILAMLGIPMAAARGTIMPFGSVTMGMLPPAMPIIPMPCMADMLLCAACISLTRARSSSRSSLSERMRSRSSSRSDCALRTFSASCSRSVRSDSLSLRVISSCFLSCHVSFSMVLTWSRRVPISSF
mmetsp:Transcript_10100/g.25191  ORF Transcript_10100/g.25191 Transcript_10100/m.25191 type:complete len:200 (-) Transcript_10100:562-1161(-)